MAASLQNIDGSTPMGANLVNGGATFRVWAPTATAVYLVQQDAGTTSPATWQKNPDDLLTKDANGFWAGYFPGVVDGDEYRFYVVGTGSEGFKRDPYARELQMNGYPNCNCIVRDPNAYVWHDQNFQPPAYSDLIIYQFHIGVFYAKDAAGNDIRPNRVSKILDVVDRIEYWVDLGVNAVMPLPFQEFQGENSLGYNGTDLFSPEMDYAVDVPDLPLYLARVNQLLANKGLPPMTTAQLTGQINQFKTFIDLCHIYGLAVIGDVVYNHAGGGFDDQCIYFFDRQPTGDNNNSLYFLSDDLAGGLVFAFWKNEVCQFLIDNGKMWLQEYHLDGLRYDEVTVIDGHGGWFFCQNLSGTERYVKSDAIQIAEYWSYNPGDRWKAIASPPDGMGFDIAYSDALRDNLRSVIAQTTGGASATVNLDPLRDALYMTYRDGARWTAFQCIENHDLIDNNHTGNDRKPRVARLADPTNSRSWYACSRSKVATGLLLTSPGVPMIFMGQEFLEDKQWSDWPGDTGLFIWWEGLEGLDKAMADQHGFTRDIMWLRRKHPALRSDGLNVFHIHNDNRILAMHRWLPDVGRDVVIVASLNESTFYDHSYRIGFPVGGYWHEVFNSDIYNNYFNPNSQGNPGGITADGPAWDGLPTSAGITIPANGLLVFARDTGDS